MSQFLHFATLQRMQALRRCRTDSFEVYRTGFAEALAGPVLLVYFDLSEPLHLDYKTTSVTAWYI